MGSESNVKRCNTKGDLNMSNAMMIALNGLGAFGKKLEVTANNTANVNTDGFKKSRTDMSAAYPDGVKVTLSKENTPGDYVPVGNGTLDMKESSNVSLEEEMVSLISTRYMYEANLKVLKTEESMTGELLDIKA
jgi:flagellar basal body rod protein FlgG